MRIHMNRMCEIKKIIKPLLLCHFPRKLVRHYSFFFSFLLSSFLFGSRETVTFNFRFYLADEFYLKLWNVLKNRPTFVFCYNHLFRGTCTVFQEISPARKRGIYFEIINLKKEEKNCIFISFYTRRCAKHMCNAHGKGNCGKNDKLFKQLTRDFSAKIITQLHI